MQNFKENGQGSRRSNFHQSAVSLPLEGNFLYQRKTLYTRILKLSPAENYYAYAEIGRIFFESGQLQKSLVQLKKAISINPDSSFAQIYLAKVFFKLEKENEAFSGLKKALCFDPWDSRAHNFVIKTFLEREKLESIDSFYQEIAETLNDLKFVAKLYYGSAQALVASDEYSKALEMYKKAFETDQMSSGEHFEYGMALYHEGFFEEAIAQFEHVKRLDPTNNVAFNNAAHLQYCLGSLQKAFEEYEHIIENGLLTVGTYSNFILVLFHMDKDEDVINHYRDIFQQNLGDTVPTLKWMYEEALRIIQVKLEKDDIDEETRNFNTKKIKGINLVLSFLT